MRTPAGHTPEEDTTLFLAGYPAPAGTYSLLGTGRQIRLDQEDVLPATCDGHVTVHERRPPTWAEMQGRTERA